MKTCKQLTIYNLPRILVVLLKRFDYNEDLNINYKLNKFFEFPFILDFREILQNINEISSASNNNDFIYDLKSIIIHSGEADKGHYYLLIKEKNSNIWNIFNDTKVNKITLSELKTEAFGYNETDNSFLFNNQSAYMLFYHKINNVFCEEFDNIKSVVKLNDCDIDNVNYDYLEDSEINSYENLSFEALDRKEDIFIDIDKNDNNSINYSIDIENKYESLKNNKNILINNYDEF